MLPRPMSRTEPSADEFDSLRPPDFTRMLEQHLVSAFPPDVALDLVLNELVVRAADATGASTAALAIFRGEEMICRAATGLHAPDAGVPLNIQDGLLGACVHTGAAQLCDDADSDPRLDPAISHDLGIRSMLIVPVFEEKADQEHSLETDPALVGILEVLSPVPNAFSLYSQNLLEEFARECAHVCRAAEHSTAEPLRILPEAEVLKSFDSNASDSPVVSPVRQPFDAWTVALGMLVILAAIAVGFMIGTRVGWLRSRQTAHDSVTPAPVAVVTADSAPPATPEKASIPPSEASPRVKANAKSPKPVDNEPAPSPGELVVYEKGKVIFRMKPPSADSATASTAAGDTRQRHASAADVPVASSIVRAASNTRIASPPAVWIAPDEAESRILTRVEPQYPTDALAARRSGNVTLEVNVAADGTVSSVRPLSGDPLLAAAAVEAVRNWRYQPYRSHEQPSPFQTDVTLTFSLPN